MKAAVLYKPGFPLPVEDVELQKPQSGEVMIKLAAAGVCHSDYHFVSGFFTPTKIPLVMAMKVPALCQKSAKTSKQ